MTELNKKSLRAWRRLDAVHAAVSTAIEQAMRAADLPLLNWYRALDALDRGPPEGMRPYQLQAALGEAQPAVSRMLDRMVGAGLVTRVVCGEDRRGWTMAATTAGREAHAKMAHVFATALSAHFVSHLGDKRMRALDDSLGDLIEASRDA